MKKYIDVFIMAATLVSVTACRVVTAFHPNIQQGGRVEALAVDPHDDDKVMVASETGGMFRSINGGNNWTWINTPLFNFTDVQYAPWNSSLVVASAASDWNQVTKGGVWVSTNGGASFVRASQADGCASCIHSRTANCIEMDSYRSQIYAGTDTGVYTGDNAGVNWTYSSPKTTGNRSVYSILTADAGSVIAMCDDGLYESINGGGVWTKIFNKPDSVDFIGRHNNLAKSPYNSNSLFMTVAYWRNILHCRADNLSNYSELWFSSDKGRSWRVIRTRDCYESRPKFVRVAKTTPASTNQLDVYAYAGVQLHKATGTQVGNNVTFGSWSDFNMPHSDISDICFNGNGSTAKLVGGDGGLFKPDGASWVYTGGGSAGYNALQVTEITGQKNTATNLWNLYFATQDNDIKSSVNHGLNWTGNRCCEGFFLNILRTTNGASPSHLTGQSCSGGCSNFRAENNLTNQQSWPNPPNDAGVPFMLDYNNYIQNTRFRDVDSNIYMLTTNYGGMWNNRFGFREAVSDFPRSTTPGANPTVFIAADNLSGFLTGEVARRIIKKIVNISGPGSPIVSTINNFGGLGTTITEFAWYKVFAVAPSDANRMMITDLEDSTIKVTYDGGGSWTVDRPLTNLVTDNGRLWFRDGEQCQVSVIAYDPGNPCHILVGTQQNGVFRTKNGGSEWEQLEGSEKIPRITSFFFMNNQVIVSSYGRGLWSLNYRFPRACPLRISQVDTSIYDHPYIRDLMVGAYVPFSDINDPTLCRVCQYLVVRNGYITNIKLDENRNLISYDKGQGKVITYDSENKQTDSIRIDQQNRGKQEVRNSVLADIIEKKEPIKGFVMENGVVKAIILSRNDFEPAQNKRYFDTNPQISLEDSAGNFYFGYSPYILRGRFWEKDVTVLLTIDDKIYEAYRTVQPNAQGTFVLKMNLPLDIGGHTITATQQVAGRVNKTVFGWNVPHMENEK